MYCLASLVLCWFPVMMMVDSSVSSWLVIFILIWCWSSICFLVRPCFPIMCPTRLAFVLIISIVSWLFCSCLFCVVWVWFSWRISSIACSMAAACICLPVWLRWYPSCSIAVLPWLMVSSVSTYLIPSSFAILSRLSLSLTMLYVIVTSLVIMGGGWTSRMLVVGWFSLMVLMASWMFSAASWYGVWFRMSLVPVMMAIVSVSLISSRVSAMSFSSVVVYWGLHSISGWRSWRYGFILFPLESMRVISLVWLVLSCWSCLCRFSICFLFSFASSFHLRHSVSVSSSFLCDSSLSWSISICRLLISVRWLLIMSLIFFSRFLMVLQWFLLVSISFWVLFLSFWMLFSSLLIFFCRSFEFCGFGCGSVVSDFFPFLSPSSAISFSVFLAFRWLLFLVWVLSVVSFVSVGSWCCSYSRLVLGSCGGFVGGSLGFFFSGSSSLQVLWVSSASDSTTPLTVSCDVFISS